MNRFGPTQPSSEPRTDYFEAVGKIALAAMKKFGAQHFRWWVNSNIYGHDALTAKTHNVISTIATFVEEQVTYSSWIVSDNHVCNVIKFTNSLLPTGLRNTEAMRKAAIRAMIFDTHSSGGVISEKYGPVYYRIRFVDSRRFAVIADLDVVIEDYDSLLSANTEKEIQECVEAITKQYTVAKLPIPKMEIVAFNKSNEEIRQ